MSEYYREIHTIKELKLWKNQYSCVQYCTELPYDNIWGIMANYLGGELFCKCTKKPEIYGRRPIQIIGDLDWIVNDFTLQPTTQSVRSNACRIQGKF